MSALKCSKCGATDPVLFSARTVRVCKLCNCAGWRLGRRTVRGHVKHLYSGMKCRVTTTNPAVVRSSTGKPILSHEAFLLWSLNQSRYLLLHASWAEAGYPRKLAPSVDRLDNTKGYVIGNMEWVTQQENSLRAWDGRRKSDQFVKAA